HGRQHRTLPEGQSGARLETGEPQVSPTLRLYRARAARAGTYAGGFDARRNGRAMATGEERLVVCRFTRNRASAVKPELTIVPSPRPRLHSLGSVSRL